MVKTLELRAWIRVGVQALLVCIAAVCLYLAYLDLSFFAVERTISSWSQRYPPTQQELDSVTDELATIVRPYHPDSLWLNAILLEWQAFNDADNARFYLIKAESDLRNAIFMRPTDPRLWAHLAVILQKQQKPEAEVTEATEKARRFGPYDPDTLKLLKRLKENVE